LHFDAMKRTLFLIALLSTAALAAVRAQQVPPPWAYTVNPTATPGAAPPPVDPAPKQVPGSTVSLTVAQTRDAYNPPDWHPNDHPPLPDAVAHGRPKENRACGCASITHAA